MVEEMVFIFFEIVNIKVLLVVEFKLGRDVDKKCLCIVLVCLLDGLL